MIQKERIQDEKWVFLSFAPGAQGFKLGKWLLKNQLVCVPHIGRQLEYNNEWHNHDYRPWLSDVFFDKNLQYELENELAKTPENQDNISNIILKTNDFNFTPIHDLKLVLTHYSSYNVLFRLQKFFRQSKIIRVTFDNVSDAHNSLLRKIDIMNHEGSIQHPTDLSRWVGELNMNYYPYLFKFDFTIDMPYNKIETLDLEFLKEKL